MNCTLYFSWLVTLQLMSTVPVNTLNGFGKFKGLSGGNVRKAIYCSDCYSIFRDRFATCLSI